MRIVERYPASIRAWKGRGAWSLLFPLRALAAAAWRYRVTRPARGVAPPAGNTVRPRVISVGNLEVGGGGKTPFAALLAGRIDGAGGVPVVVTRGYGGRIEQSGGGPVAVLAGRTIDDEAAGGVRVASEPPDPGETGDEACLFAARGIPVVIDPDRARGIAAAIALFDPTHVILDDAFQHRAAWRDLDILLLDHERPFGDGRIMPLGTLREPPSAVSRAGAVVFTRAGDRTIPAAARRLVAGLPVAFARHRPLCLRDTAGRPRPLETLAARRVLLFSGIARPTGFEELAAPLCGEAATSVRFGDHHRYTAADVRMLLEDAGEETTLVTTEKDWTKVRRLLPPAVDAFAIEIELAVDGLDDLPLFAGESA